MKPSVVAVVISHDEKDFLSATLTALKTQIHAVEKIILIDTSSNEDCFEVARAAGVTELHRLAPNTSLPQSIAEGFKLAGDVDWVWLLHDDSAPQPDALAKMMAAIELSPSVAIAGPKLVDWNNERVVNQLGLTLTPMGNLFSIVSGDLDQSQHDDLDDVMAVSTAAALIRTDVFKQLAGFDYSAPAFAADFDFSIRARLAGHRVIVVPSAKVSHAALSFAGKRERKWLGTNPKTALRRGAIHLRLAYAPMAAALAFWLLLPLIGLGRAIGKLAAKRPDRIWGELSAAAWGFFTLGKRLSSRRGIARTSTIPFRRLRSLRATWQQVRSSNLAALEREQTESTLAAFERGEFEVEENSKALGFVASGGLWITAALAALSFTFWPTAEAVTGGGLLPLSANWIDLFTRAGASFQPIGLGYYGPSDPFVWVLTVIGALTFWSPSLSIAILIFLAKPIAFAGAWRVTALFTQNSYIRGISALVYAIWPAITLAQHEGRLGALIAQLTLPWLVLAVARAASIGRASSSTQTWSWVAASALLLVVIGASAPNTLPILLLVLGLVIAARIRRFGYLIWIPLPLAAIFGPTFIYYLIGLFKPLALLADPGLPQASEQLQLWQFLLGGETFGIKLPIVGALSGWVIVPVILVSVIALLGRRWGVAFSAWVLLIAALALAWLVSHLEFAAVGIGSTTRSTDFVNGSPAALLGIVGLLLATLVAIALDAISKPKALRAIAVALAVLTFVPSIAIGVTNGNQFKYTDGRVVPSIIAAEASQGSQLKALVINPEVKSDGSLVFGAELVSGDGVQLEDVSLSYRFALESVKRERASEYLAIEQLVADLASANGTSVQQKLDESGIGYVLVPDQTSAIASQLAIALDSVAELESVGSTDFGRLWRVRTPNQELLNAEAKPQAIWSITKVIQLSILLGFILLAIPSTNQRRRVSGDSQIFVEAGEEN